jgi:D-3-phosphoglycerate dehydrogenase / 2-oxoglutarate reductase
VKEKGYLVHTDADHPVEPEDRREFERLGAELVFIQTRAEFLRAAPNAIAVLNSGFRLTSDLIETLARCLILSRYGSGVDNIDVAAATRRGIPVANVPVFCVEEVANRAFTLLLACSCELLQLDNSARSGVWGVHNLPYTAQIEGGILGLIGYGKIGRAVARRAKAFGLRVIAYDPLVSHQVAAADDVALRELDDLLRLADYVSVHTPLTAETFHLIDDRRLRLMKPSAMLVNTARGAVIEEKALVDALRYRRIAGAGLDVFEEEPPARDHPLFTLDNVILTPHCAAHTALATQKVRRGAMDAIMMALAGQEPPHIVNAEVFATKRTASPGVSA